MRRTSVTLVAVALLMAGMAWPASGGAASERQATVYGFATSDSSVTCQISEDYGVRCDSAKLVGYAPPPTTTCHADYGASVSKANYYGLPVWGCVGDAIDVDDWLPPGQVVERYGIRCTVGTGSVRCADVEYGFGFEVGNPGYSVVRPPAKSVLTTWGMKGLPLGITLDKAVRTKKVWRFGSCGPELRRNWGLGVRFKRLRLDELDTFNPTKVQTTKGIGVGSSVAELLSAYPTATGPFPTTTHADGGTVPVYLVEGRRGRLVFIIFSAGRTTAAPQDLVSGMLSSRSWKPSKGLLSGC